MASSSWKPPREMRLVSDEPARRSRGKALTLALPIYGRLISQSGVCKKQWSMSERQVEYSRIGSYI